MSNPVAGAWQLVFFAVTNAAGEALNYPMGEQPRGLLIYTADGWMSVHLSYQDRPHFTVDHQRGGTQEEKSAAMETYFSYGGTYEFTGGKVVHHITISSFPNWVGASQWRNAKLDGDRLTLKTPLKKHSDGVDRQSTLVWQRAQSRGPGRG